MIELFGHAVCANIGLSVSLGKAWSGLILRNLRNNRMQVFGLGRDVTGLLRPVCLTCKNVEESERQLLRELKKKNGPKRKWLG
jgi:DNA-binding HxlR family transcriptional regulator